MQNRVIPATERQDTTKHALHLGRQQGQVPGVLYGHGVRNLPIWVEARGLQSVMQQASTSPIFQLTLSGAEPESVLIKDVQRDALSRQLRHIDLQVVNMHEQVQMEIPIHLQGDAPGERTGETLELGVREITVRALPQDLPEAILLDISHLVYGQRITVADLTIPAGVELVTEPDLLVVAIMTQGASEDDETEEDAATPVATKA